MGFSLKKIVSGAGDLLGKAGKSLFDTAVGGIGSAVGSLAGDALSGLFGKSSSKDYQKQLDANMAYQKEMLDYTNMKNLEYNKDLSVFNNEQTKQMSKYMYDNYQSPAAQVQAYKAAGLNPYMLSSAGSFSPTSTSVTSGGASPASSGSSYQRYQYDTSINPLSMEYQQAQTDMTNALAEGYRIANERALTEKPYWFQNAYEKARSYILGNKSAEAMIQLNNANEKKARQEVINLITQNNKTTEELNNLLINRDFILASVEEKRKMIEQIDKNISIGSATIALLGAQKEFQEALKALTDEQKNTVIEAFKGIKTVQDIQDAQKKLIQFQADVPNWVKYVQLGFQTVGSLLGANVSLNPLK